MRDAAIRLLMVLGWTAALPLVGFSIFGILTILPLFGVLLGFELLAWIYAAGAVPAFVTAAGFEFVFRHWGLMRSFAATVTVGAAVSVVWMEGVFLFEGEEFRLSADYVTFALALTGALPAALMPLTRFAQDRRRWH